MREKYFLDMTFASSVKLPNSILFSICVSCFLNLYITPASVPFTQG